MKEKEMNNLIKPWMIQCGIVLPYNLSILQTVKHAVICYLRIIAARARSQSGYSVFGK